MSLKRLRSDSEEGSVSSFSENNVEDDFKESESDIKCLKDSRVREKKRAKASNRSSTGTDREERISPPALLKENQRIKQEDVEKLLYESDENDNDAEPSKADIQVGGQEAANGTHDSDGSERSKNESAGSAEHVKPREKGSKEAATDSDSECENLPLSRVKAKETGKTEIVSGKKKIKSPPESSCTSDSDDVPLKSISSKTDGRPSSGTKSITTSGKKARLSFSDRCIDSASKDSGDVKLDKTKPRFTKESESSTSDIDVASNKIKNVIPARKRKTFYSKGRGKESQKSAVTSGKISERDQKRPIKESKSSPESDSVSDKVITKEEKDISSDEKLKSRKSNIKKTKVENGKKLRWCKGSICTFSKDSVVLDIGGRESAVINSLEIPEIWEPVPETHTAKSEIGPQARVQFSPRLCMPTCPPPPSAPNDADKGQKWNPEVDTEYETFMKRLQIEFSELQNYKSKLDIMRMERELRLPPSTFTRALWDSLLRPA